MLRGRVVGGKCPKRRGGTQVGTRCCSPFPRSPQLLCVSVYTYSSFIVRWCTHGVRVGGREKDAFHTQEVKHLEGYPARCRILEKRLLLVGRCPALWKGSSLTLGGRPSPVLVQNEAGSPGTMPGSLCRDSTLHSARRLSSEAHKVTKPWMEWSLRWLLSQATPPSRTTLWI